MTTLKLSEELRRAAYGMLYGSSDDATLDALDKLLDRVEDAERLADAAAELIAAETLTAPGNMDETRAAFADALDAWTLYNGR